MTISTADDGSSDAAFIAEIDELVRHWLDVAAARGEDRSAKRLAALLKDPAGLDFTVAFVDRVVRPEDVRVAAASLRELAAHPPRFLSWYLASPGR
jgi:RHH-type proline utilization regulon transcriptional repressor/proline dehydrogenase/delta 1-pyrroline-5-carboxylate dehydrogenase